MPSAIRHDHHMRVALLALVLAACSTPPSQPDGDADAPDAAPVADAATDVTVSGDCATDCRPASCIDTGCAPSADGQHDAASWQAFCAECVVDCFVAGQACGNTSHCAAGCAAASWQCYGTLISGSEHGSIGCATR